MATGHIFKNIQFLASVPTVLDLWSSFTVTSAVSQLQFYCDSSTTAVLFMESLSFACTYFRTQSTAASSPPKQSMPHVRGSDLNNTFGALPWGSGDLG